MLKSRVLEQKLTLLRLRCKVLCFPEGLYQCTMVVNTHTHMFILSPTALNPTVRASSMRLPQNKVLLGGRMMDPLFWVQDKEKASQGQVLCSTLGQQG